MKNHKTIVGWMAALFMTVGSANSLAQTNDQANSNAGVPAPAQGASNEQEQSEQVLKMSAFEVTTTQGEGYVATTAASAFKTNQTLMDIPQGDIVVTSDFIRDIAYENNTDVLQYFGVQQLIQGALMEMRGTSIQTNPYVDDMITHSFYEDDYIMDSYEVIKGPTQSLYVGAALSGIVQENTKKPLPYEQNIVTASVDQWGLFRTTLDSTGPLGKIGDFDFGYRLVAVYEHGHEYFNNTPDDRYALFPEIQIRYKNTTVRAYWNGQSTSGEAGLAFMTPSGQLETSMGWKALNQYSPGNSPDNWRGRTVYVSILQKISDNWESKLSAANWKYDIDAPGEEADYVNWDNDTETWIDERLDEHWENWTVLNDYQGHYELGPENWRMPQTDAFGFMYTSATDKDFFFQTTGFPYPNGPIGGTVTVPFSNPEALYAIPVAPPNNQGPPSVANWDKESYAHYIEAQTSGIYWQHTMEVIPERLEIVTGWTWDNVATQSVDDWALLPWTGVNISVSQWTHRFGAVLHVTKEVSLYALDSTNFLIPSGATLQNGTLAPPQLGIGRELGIKWNLFNGRMSGEGAWFKAVTTNGLNRDAGSTNGVEYAAIIGDETEEGIDGDAAFVLVPGWQLIGSWYAGHEVDPFGNPVAFSEMNSLSMFTRLDFGKLGLFRGLALGGGFSRNGGRWMSLTDEVSTKFYIPPEVKVQTGTMINAFLSYEVNKHLGFRVSVANLGNSEYIIATEGDVYCDPSEPRDFTFEMHYKF